MKIFTKFKIVIPLCTLLLLCGMESYGQCGFNVSNNTPCGLTSVQMTANNPGSYTWDMNGDGIIDASGNNPFYIFPATTIPISYTITQLENGVACATQNIVVQPKADPSIGVLPGQAIMQGNQIRLCSGSPDATLSIFNASSTLSTNVGYEINWGDGSIENYDNTTFSAATILDHDYSGFGYYTITVTTTSLYGCNAITSYLFYNGSNPSVGMANPGNTVGLCVPATITFPIFGTDNNPTGTNYNVYIAGILVDTFTQENIPTEYSYTFLETSCDINTTTSNYENAFDIQIVATNPCGSSQATIEPIELSSPPQPVLLVEGGQTFGCEFDDFSFSNGSTGIGEVISGNPSTCGTTLTPSWTITPGVPGVHWEIEDGNLFSSDELEIEFLIPGDYTLTMILNSQACGVYSASQVINVLEAPVADATATVANASNPPGLNECAPAIASFTNLSSGDSITYEWIVDPPTGWEYYNGSTATSTDFEILITEPGEYEVDLRVTNKCTTEKWDTTFVLAGVPEIVFDPIPDFCETAVLNFDEDNIEYIENGGSISSYDWSFPGASPATSSDQYPTNIVYNTPGEYIVSATLINQCGSAVYQDTFVIVEPGTLTLDPDLSLCANAASFSLNAVPSGGTWSGDGVDEDGLFTPSENNIGANILTYTYGDGSCSIQDNMTVTVRSLPTVEAGANQNACIQDAPLLISGGTPANGTWTINNNGVLIGNNVFDPEASGEGVYTLTYTFQDEFNCTNSDTKTIIVSELPEVDAGPDQTLCDVPSNISLSGYTPFGGIWTGVGVTAWGSFNVANTPGVGEYQLYYSYTDPTTTCTNIDSLTITIEANIVAEAGAPEMLCIDDETTTINTATPTGGTWIGPGIIDASGDFDPTIAGVGTHVLTYSVGQGICVDEDTKIITVNALPNITLPNNQLLCINAVNFDLSQNTTPAGGTWSGSGIQGNSFQPALAGLGVHTLSYTFTNPTTNCSNSKNFQIEVTPLPEIFVNDTTYCNTPNLVQLPIATPANGTWTGPGVSGNNFDPQAVNGPGVYTLVYSYTNGNNCTNTTNVNITLIAPQDITLPADIEICLDATIIDLSLSTTPTNGTWSANGSDGLFDHIFNPTLAGEGTHILTYSIGVGNCTVSENLQIIVHPLPQVNTGQDQEICSTETSLSLTPTPEGGTWIAHDGGQLNGNDFLPSASGKGTYHFTYTFTDDNGCIASDDLEIVVHPQPILTTSDTTYCRTPGMVRLPYTTPTGGTWTGPGVFNNFFDPMATGTAGFYVFTYSYTDNFGCSNITQANVELIPPTEIFAGNDRTVCIDEPAWDLALNAFPSGGFWLSASTGLSGSTFDPVAAGPGSHLVTYSIGTGNCEVNDSILIIVNALPAVEAGNDLAFCYGKETRLLQGYSPEGGTWEGQGLTSSAPIGFDPATVNEGSYTLKYSFIEPTTGCYNEDTRQVTVNPLVEPNFDMPLLACRNEAIQLNNLSPGNYQAVWDFDDGNTSNEFAPSHSFASIGEYNVLLKIENEFGCWDTIRRPITITDVPNAFFVPDTLAACGGLNLNMNNQSFGEGLSYFWTFGDGQTSTEENPGAVFFNAGVNDTTYVITLTVTNICGMSSFEQIVTIHPLANAEIGISPQTDCSPLIIDFANTSTGGITSYFWDFGNGNISTEALPDLQTYTTDTTTTTYTAMLIASNICGADTVLKDIVVEPAMVQAFMQASDDFGCTPLTVDFTNYSTPGAVVEWNFGDGNTSSITNPSHTFEEPGTYTIIQYAYSDCGYDTTTFEITTIPSPEVSFIHNPFVCLGQEITFDNLSENTFGNFWDFGDGDTSSLVNPTHVFDEPGEYTVTLRGLSTANQCPSIFTSTITVRDLPTATFDAPVTFGCAPLSINFESTSENVAFFSWDFGDGNTSISEHPNHVFEEAGTFEVTLRVTDNFGCFHDTSLLNILVNPVPEAIFDFEKEQVCGVPADIYFENLSEGASGFQWIFGDDTNSNFNDPTHTYNSSGDFNVKMIAVNEFGCQDTTAEYLTVYPKPEADFEIGEKEGCAPLTVEFVNQSIHAENFAWNFGDGNITDDRTPRHVFEEAGNFNVELIVNIAETCYDTMYIPNLVQVNETPIASFEPIEETIGNQGTGVFQFDNQSQFADFFFWDFGDGTTSEDFSPTHRYNNNGNRQIYLEASTEYGCVHDTLLSLLPTTIKGLFIPNGFSPEQGIGDVRLFRPKGVGIKEYQIRVFSTYGQLIWESQELTEDGQPAEAWDGTYNGKLMPQDVYVWKAKAIFEDGTVWPGQKNDKGKLKAMGSVILLR